MTRISARRLMPLLAMVVTLLVGAVPAGATFPGTNGKIAFTRDIAGNQDIFVVNADGSGATRLTNHPDDDFAPTWSPDGRYIAFISKRDLANFDGYPDLWVMNADGSDQRKLSPFASGARDINWFADGTRILYNADHCTELVNCGTKSINRDGGGLQDFGEGGLFFNGIKRSPRGEPFAYPWSGEIRLVNDDGTGFRQLFPPTQQAQEHLDWSPDGRSILYDNFSNTRIVDWQTAAVQIIPNSQGALQPDWSPDGTRFAFTAAGRIGTMRLDGTERTTLTTGDSADTDPDWQTIDKLPGMGHIRPRTANLVEAPLVPAFTQCTPSGTNRTHGPPLAYPSCHPPQPSPFLTVGTADSNGLPTRSVGAVNLRALNGNPGTPESEADMTLQISISDVRCRFVDVEQYPCAGPLTDYTGKVQMRATMRITERFPLGYEPPPFDYRLGTIVDIPFRADVPCSETLDASGAACELTTTTNALLPYAITENRRTIWEVGAIEILDAGSDGDVTTLGDNRPFARQGIFVP
jgi:TolB protein